MHVFNWRADGLDLKVDMSYEDRLEQEISVEQQALIWPASSLPKDHVGPVALVTQRQRLMGTRDHEARTGYP